MISNFEKMWKHKGQGIIFDGCLLRNPVTLAWILSAILWCPAILLWPQFYGRTIPANECYVQFLQESNSMTILTSIIAFYLPDLVFTFYYIP